MAEERSMIQIAFEFISKRKKPTPFKRIWEEIIKVEKLSESQADELIANFYTELTLDGRIVNVGNNEWDLRSRIRFDSIKDNYSEDAEDEEEKEEESLSEDEDEDEEDEDLDEEAEEDEY